MAAQTAEHRGHFATLSSVNKDVIIKISSLCLSDEWNTVTNGFASCPAHSFNTSG